MKSIFNSLGSNYNQELVLLSLRQLLWPKKHQSQVLKQKLDDLFAADAHLFYKGRDAIQFALSSYGIGQGDQVLTQAFTCFAIEQAIVRTQATPVFVDIDDSLNLTVESLEKAFKTAKSAKAVLVQNTLGSPAQIVKIKKWCDQHKLLLIEDLAQSFGATDQEGKLLGTYADVVILSFGRDKIIDSVSGGACLFKNVQPVKVKPDYQKVTSFQIMKDLLYPSLTMLIRKTDQFILGKIIFQLARKLKLLTSPVLSPTTQIADFPDQLAPLTLLMIRDLDLQLKHRQVIAQIYQQKLAVSDQQSEFVTSHGTNQRFFFSIKKSQELISYLEQNHIYISDRWYRQPVDSGKIHAASSYQLGSCPVAQKLCETVMNLPTHLNVSADDAHKISQYINKWLKTYV